MLYTKQDPLSRELLFEEVVGTDNLCTSPVEVTVSDTYSDTTIHHHLIPSNIELDNVGVSSHNSTTHDTSEGSRESPESPGYHECEISASSDLYYTTNSNECPVIVDLSEHQQAEQVLCSSDVVAVQEEETSDVASVVHEIQLSASKAINEDQPQLLILATDQQVDDEIYIMQEEGQESVTLEMLHTADQPISEVPQETGWYITSSTSYMLLRFSINNQF